MTKCKDCIFEFDSICKNPESKWMDFRTHEIFDGCNEGEKSTVGISALQQLALMCEVNRTAGEQNG